MIITHTCGAPVHVDRIRNGRCPWCPPDPEPSRPAVNAKPKAKFKIGIINQ